MLKNNLVYVLPQRGRLGMGSHNHRFSGRSGGGMVKYPGGAEDNRRQ